MTAQPIDQDTPFANEPRAVRAHHLDRCERFNVNPALLDDPVQGVALRQWFTAMGERFPYRWEPFDVGFEPFNGDPTPVFHDAEPVEEKPSRSNVFELPPNRYATEKTTTAPDPMWDPFARPTSPVAPVEGPAAEGTAEETAGLTGTPWEDRHIEVHCDVYQRYNPDHAVAVTILRDMITDQGDLYVHPARDAARLGVTVKVLKEWLHPHRGAFRADVRLRTDADGRLNYRHITPDGDERWRVTVRKIGKVTGDDGKQTIATKNDWYVGVPKNWLYEHPDTVDGDYYKRRTDISNQAVWAAAVVKAEARGQAGTRKAIWKFAKDWNKSTGAVKKYMAAGEDAGLVVVTGSRAGQTDAYRGWKQTPTENTTSATRMPNQPMPESCRTIDADFAGSSEDDLPF